MLHKLDFKLLPRQQGWGNVKSKSLSQEKAKLNPSASALAPSFCKGGKE